MPLTALAGRVKNVWLCVYCCSWGAVTLATGHDLVMMGMRSHGSAADSAPGSQHGESDCEIYIDPASDTDDMSDPFEDASDAGLVHGNGRVPSYSQHGPCEVVLPDRFSLNDAGNHRDDKGQCFQDIQTAITWLKQEIVSIYSYEII